MKIERTRNATRNIFFGGLLKFYQIVVPFLMRTAMIYIMGMQYLGLNSLFTSILQVLNLAELGVGSAMVYSMYKPIAENDIKTNCALMQLYKKYYMVIGMIIAIAGVIILPFIPKIIKIDTVPSGINIYALYLLNLGSTVLSYWLFAYKNCLISAHQRTDVNSKICLVMNTVQYICQLVVLIIFHNYYYYVIVTLGSQAVTNIVTAIVVDKMYPEYRAKGQLDKDVVNQINGRVKDLFTAKIGSVVVNSADTIVISAFLGLTVLAVYQNYYFVLNAIFGFFYIIFSGITAGMGNSFVTESVDKNFDDLKLFSFIINWLICICCCCFTGLYQPFMLLWVGSEYVLPYSYVVLFCIYFYVYVLSLVWATAKDAAGIWHSDRFRPLVGAIANLVMNLAFVKLIGLYGVLLSTIFSYVLISMPWLIHNLSKELYKKSMVPYILTVGKQILVTLFSCIIVFAICQLIKISGVLGLLIYAVLCIIIPNVIQYVVFKRFNEYSKASSLVRKMLKHE